MSIITTKSPEETKGFAKEFAKNLKPGDILGLVGDLGGGKTTFVKGLALAFGVREEILSPTFQLIREYKPKKQETGNPSTKLRAGKKQVKKFYHLDLYRLQTPREAEELGLSELFSEKQAIFVIEWADKVKKFLPQRTKWIGFDFVDENTRKIIIR